MEEMPGTTRAAPAYISIPIATLGVHGWAPASLLTPKTPWALPRSQGPMNLGHSLAPAGPTPPLTSPVSAPPDADPETRIYLGLFERWSGLALGQ